MYSGGCDAAIAKASAAVTHVQSPSQEVGSGDKGLGLLCFDLSSTETDFGDFGTSITSPIFVLRLTSYCVHRGSGQVRVYPRR